MQEHTLYVFTVQSNGAVATTPHTCRLLRFTLPPGKVLYPPFCIKMTAKDARAVIKNHVA